MAAENPFQVLGGIRSHQGVEPFALAIEQEQRHVTDTVLTSKGPAFVGSDIGDEKLDFTSFEFVHGIPRLALQGRAFWALRVVYLDHRRDTVSES